MQKKKKKLSSFSWMGREFLPDKNQNNMLVHLCHDATTTSIVRLWLIC